MKPLSRKRATTVHTALALSLLVLSATALLLYYLAPLRTGDKKLDALADAAIPRFFLTVFLFVLAKELFPACLKNSRVSLKVLPWCALPFLVAVVNFPFSALIRGAARVTRADLFGLFLAKCFLIGASEEILFRGIVLGALSEAHEKKGRSRFYPVLLSSVIFALFHFVNLLSGAGILAVLQQVGYSFLIGAMLAAMLWKTENLWLCVTVHALFDFGGFFLSDLGVGNPHDTTFWILTIVVGVLCAVQMIVTLVRKINSPR